ncbi:MAG: DUF2934 domain-containing protein [Deltaproteobacteria bacterium]|nr:DUF2934 domain-containing protein [Deltaproteobacteria bacterium]
MTKETRLRNSKGKARVDQQTLNEMIEKKAYEIYEQRGREHGKDLDDWLEAEKIVKKKERN